MFSLLIIFINQNEDLHNCSDLNQEKKMYEIHKENAPAVV